jgi:hypothetical protein
VGSRFLLKSPRAHFCLAVGAISQPRSRGIVADVSDTPASPWRARGRNNRLQEASVGLTAPVGDFLVSSTA